MDKARIRQEVEGILDGKIEAECQHCERIMLLAQLASSHGEDALTAMAAVLVERFHRGELRFNDADRTSGGQTFALLKVLGQNRHRLDHSLAPDFIDLYFDEGVIVSSWFDYRSIIGLVLARIGNESHIRLADELARLKEDFAIGLSRQNIFLLRRYHNLNERLLDNLAKNQAKSE